jgi:iron complex outermembrane receptor protein
LRKLAISSLNRRFALRSGAALTLLASVPWMARGESAAVLDSVVVTATRISEDSRDLPVSIDRVEAQTIRNGQLQVNLSESLLTVPGVSAQSRQNYAQDLQVSVRGFGARSSFGVRGVRLYSDGIPGTMPDGQGQFSQFDLGSAQDIEVLRGPFSALYGNSSGGVIQLFSADGSAPDQVRGSAGYGSFGMWRAAVDARGAAGSFNYNADFTHFSVDGYRPHSSAGSESFNAKLGYGLSDGNHLSLIVNVLSRPDAQDPLGLTPQQFAAGTDQANPNALLFDTRKSLQQQQAGLIWNSELSDTQSLQVMGYGGHRSVLQFLAIPQGAQLSRTSSGGVVDLDRDFAGGDARWAWRTELAGMPFSWIVGVSYDWQNELRRGFDNFIGKTLGVQGELRRDENDVTYDIDEYSQLTWDLGARWSLSAGVRHSDVNFTVHDHFITPTNGDDSGATTFGAGTPVAGVVFKALPNLNLYASYGRGFQTPLGSELAYRPDGLSGINFDLRPARSVNVELGAKLQVQPSVTAEATVFETNTQNEIVVDTSLGGRSTYQNSGRTRRRGAEAGNDWHLGDAWHLQLAYTYVDATYRDAYHTCTSSPCAVPQVLVAAGNRLPGVPRSDAFVQLRFGNAVGMHYGATAQYVSSVPVNDVNSVFASGYAVFGANAGYGGRFASGNWNAFVRINNLFDRHYVGSVIVDDSNHGYFESAAPFTLLVGGTFTWF